MASIVLNAVLPQTGYCLCPWGVKLLQDAVQSNPLAQTLGGPVWSFRWTNTKGFHVYSQAGGEKALNTPHNRPTSGGDGTDQNRVKTEYWTLTEC